MRYRRRTLLVASVVLLMTAGVPVAVPVGAAEGDRLAITESLTLSGDHHGWISIEASNVTLDCAGYAIIGTRTDTDVTPHGVYVGHRTGVTIRNCVISKVNQGIALVGTTDSLIENNTIRGVRQGVILDGASEGNRIFNNAIDEASDFFGILIIGESDENQVIGNRVEQTPVAYLVNGTNGHTFEANIAEHNNSAFEFLDSHDNQITGNEARHHGRGFVLGDGASNNTVSENLAEVGELGFVLFGGAHHNELSANTSSGHGGGEFAFYDADWNTAVDNTSDGAGIGFTVWGSSNNALERNLVTGASSNGVWVVDRSSGNTIEDNVISGNHFGIRVENSAGNIVEDNVASDNSGDGILVTDSSDTQISGNTASDNGLSGIAVWRSSGSLVWENRTDDNLQHGVFAAVTDGSLSRFWENTGCGNGIADGADYSQVFGFGIGPAEWTDNTFCTFLIEPSP